MLPHLIFHFSSIVLYDESVFLSLRFLVELIVFVYVVELVQKIFIAATREARQRDEKCEEREQSAIIQQNSLARIVQYAQQSCRL